MSTSHRLVGLFLLKPRPPTAVVAPAIVVFALSLIALIFSVTIFEENSESAWIMLVLGVLGIVVSSCILVLNMRRKKLAEPSLPPPPVFIG